MKDLKNYYKEKDQPEKGNISRWHKFFLKFKKDLTKEVILDIGC